MNPAFFAVVLSTALTSAAVAQESQSQFEPVPKNVIVPSPDHEGVRRDAGPSRAFQGVALRKATVADIDLNGNGHVSFEELLRFDVKKDF